MEGTSDRDRAGGPGRLRRASVQFVLVAVAVAALDAGALDNDFVFDDRLLLADPDGFLHDPANLRAVFGVDVPSVMGQTDYGASRMISTYRPLTLATFFWDAHWSGVEPLGYHITNLAVHLGCVALVFLLAAPLVGRERAGLAPFAALLFGIHPVPAEAHIWISGRTDSLCALFTLLALYLHLRAADADRPVRRAILLRGLAAGAFFAACLSKETVVAVLPVFVLLEGGFFGLPSFARKPGSLAGRSASAFARAAGLFAAAAAYIALRIRALDAVEAGAPGQIAAALQYLPVLLWDGLRQLVAPATTAMREIGQEYRWLPNFVPVLAWVAITAAGAAATMLRNRLPAVAFGLAWYAASLAPAAMVVPVSWPGFGRYLYLPFAALAIALVDLADRIRVRMWMRASRAMRAAPAAAAAVYVALLAALTLKVVADYRDDESFYRAIVAESPRTSHGYRGLGLLCATEGRYNEAIPLLERSLEIEPRSAGTWLNLGLSYLLADPSDPAAAHAVAEMGIRNAAFPEEFYNLGVLSVMNTDPRLASRYLVEGLLVAPEHPGLRSNARRLSTEHPRRAEFRAAIEALIEEPRFAPLRTLLRVPP